MKKSKVEIKVHQVNLNIYEMDKLKLEIKGKNEQLKYYQNQYIKLMHKLDNKENFGLNCMLFTYEELIQILQSKYHWLKEYINRWFEIDEDLKDDEGNYLLYFSEDAIEVEKGDYWLVHVKNDYATCFKDINQLNRKIYELEKEGDSNE